MVLPHTKKDKFDHLINILVVIVLLLIIMSLILNFALDPVTCSYNLTIEASALI